MNIYKELENPQLAKRLMELFCEEKPLWMCYELLDDPKEYDLCSDNCKWCGKIPEECVVRYIKMQFRQEGKS